MGGWREGGGIVSQGTKENPLGPKRKKDGAPEKNTGSPHCNQTARKHGRTETEIDLSVEAPSPKPPIFRLHKMVLPWFKPVRDSDATIWCMRNGGALDSGML